MLLVAIKSMYRENFDLLRVWVFCLCYPSANLHSLLVENNVLILFLASVNMCFNICPAYVCWIHLLWDNMIICLSYLPLTSCLHILSVTTFQSMKSLKGPQESNVCLALWRLTGVEMQIRETHMMTASKKSSSGAALPWSVVLESLTFAYLFPLL